MVCTLKSLIMRHPVAFALAVTLALVGLVAATKSALPALSISRTADVFPLQAALLAIILLAGLQPAIAVA
jgi:hypothetical protein